MRQDRIFQYEDETDNTITGCNKISPGCKHCYAEDIALKYQKRNWTRWSNGFAVTIRDADGSKLYKKYKGKRDPKLIFINSMADLFHVKVPVDHIKKVFETVEKLDKHRFIALTKRSERLVQLDPQLTWPSNLIMGVSIENEQYKSRLDDLKRCSAKWKSLSLEPLIGPITNMNLQGIDWVICGGEKADKPRPLDPDWVRDIRDQCVNQSVPFTFKQWGGKNRYTTRNILDGEIWIQVPKKFLGGIKIEITAADKQLIKQLQLTKGIVGNPTTILPVINEDKRVGLGKPETTMEVTKR